MERTLDEKRDLVHELRRMQDSSAWRFLVSILQGQIEGREQQIIINPLDTSEAVHEERVMKAERLTFKLLTILPQTAMENLEAEIQEEMERNGNSE